MPQPLIAIRTTRLRHQTKKTTVILSYRPAPSLDLNLNPLQTVLIFDNNAAEVAPD